MLTKLVGKQIPIKCYFIYYLNETTIYDLRKSKTILVSPYRVIAIISNSKVHWKSHIPPLTILYFTPFLIQNAHFHRENGQ